MYIFRWYGLEHTEKAVEYEFDGWDFVIDMGLEIGPNMYGREFGEDWIAY